MVSNYKIKEEDLPGLFQVADKASVKAQRLYLLLVRLNLLFLVSSAMASAIIFSDIEYKRGLAITSAIILTLSITVNVVMRLISLERTWYNGRAVAESVKTLAWRYITCSEPYNSGLSPQAVDTSFLKQLKEIMDESKDMNSLVGGKGSNSPQITHTMREYRNLGIEYRKELYLQERIISQRDWYSGRAEYNKNRSTLWFVIIIVSQVLALGSAIYLVVNPLSPIKLTGLLTTIASSFIAWLQVKQHQELSQSYSIAAQELGLILEQGQHIHTEEDFCAFVSDSENAISREHTLWVARRDKKCR